MGPGKERGCATCGTTYRGRRPTEIELQGRRKESPAHMAVAVVAQWMPAYSKYGLAEDVQFNIVSPPQLSGGAFQQRREVSSEWGRFQGIGRRGETAPGTLRAMSVHLLPPLFFWSASGTSVFCGYPRIYKCKCSPMMKSPRPQSFYRRRFRVTYFPRTN